MVKTIKTWENVTFCAAKKSKDKETVLTAHVYLEYNHATRAYRLNTPNQEMVSFNNDSIELTELKLEALTAAINYIKKLQKQDEKGV